MTDQDFPLICYPEGDSAREWGRFHGEEYREGIQQLAEIRRELMRARNGSMTDSLIQKEAEKQWSLTKNAYLDIWEELDGIREGSGLRMEDIVVLNNYTDFRDLSVDAEEGCSTVFVEKSKQLLCGQTWDMHSSAKNYVCVVRVPFGSVEEGNVGFTYLFSLVGCVGMMGFNPDRAMIGVNNLNGNDARSGIIWPALVRAVLNESNFEKMDSVLQSAEVTSGHAYLYANQERAKMVELFPSAVVTNAEHTVGKKANFFHTNHCLGEETMKLEQDMGVASTTHNRYALLKKKVPKVTSLDDMYSLLTDHEEYPKSICSHFESGAQDPSFTCGGAIGDLNSGKIRFWRGCPEYDANYREFELSLSEA